MTASKGSDRPPFIVVEGLDGAGTTTQCRLLVERLRDEGVETHSTREPSDGPVGALVRQMLAGRIVIPDGETDRSVSSDVLALLFAADRLDHVDAEIEPALRAGRCVVSDRYYHSSFAYQADRDGDGELDTTWVRTLNERAPRPDLTAFLDAPVEVCLERLGARGRRDRFEDRDQLESIRRRYEAVVDELRDDERIVRIDATRSVEAVHDELYESVADLPELERGAGGD